MLSLETPFKEKLRKMYRTAPVDVPSFHRLYKVCSASDCEAICCHGGSGFYLTTEEPETIRALVRDKREFFEAQGLDMSVELFSEDVVDEETGETELSTNTRPVTYHKAGLRPDHFPSESCVFRTDKGACSLQMLSIAEGKHGWWYKPVACWLYPIELEHAGKPFIRIAHPTTDEYVDDKYPGFVEFTPCGKECAGGEPAYKVVGHEIEMLSKLIDRDLMTEILAYKAPVA
jgi:hypothetical protein